MMSIKITNRLKNNILPILFLFLVSCEGEKDCEYIPGTANDVIPIGCDLESDLNLTTGFNTDGTLIIPGDGVVDPSWRVLNNPPLFFCEGNPLAATINGNAYAINFASFGPNDWVNQSGATTLAPVDLGTTNGFGCNNATNSEGNIVPYVFERSFCVLNDTYVNFNFSYKGDDRIYLELIKNNTNTVISSSTIYNYPAAPMIWTANNLALSSGSYSVRAYLANVNSVVLGFSVLGNLTTSNGDQTISNNNDGCCENNTISILNTIDTNCNATFDTGDLLGKNWVINVKDSSNQTIRSGQTDANGNIFFGGIPNGTYTVQIVTQAGFNTATTSFTVNLSNNNVEIVQFFNCPI